MKRIRNKTFGEERALYNTRDAVIEHCRVEGPEDGESFLKESGDVLVKDCYLDLRYPFWHCERLTVEECEMSANCRAALWYGRDIHILRSKLYGIKALRECEDVRLEEIEADSDEFGWRCGKIDVKGGKIASEYAFFESKGIRAEGLEFSGKYSFQYTKDVLVRNARLRTKDAFWHAENVMLENCVLDGEYIGWYSEGLTLVHCRIAGTQPFCYCKRLRLVDCVMEQCDLAFEYSDVDADITGEVLSVKNPLSGRIVADTFGKVILEGSKYECNAEIVARRTLRKTF